MGRLLQCGLGTQVADHVNFPRTLRSAQRTLQTPKSMAERALLLIAHGSRRAEANADLVTLAEMVRARQPADVVEIASLSEGSPLEMRAAGFRHAG